MRLRNILMLISGLWLICLLMPVATAQTLQRRVFVPLVLKYTPPPPPTYEEQVLNLINTHRANAGCNPLTMDSRLQTAAELHSQDMALNNFFSHTGSNGSTMVQRVEAQGYTWTALAENIAAGQTTPQAVVDGWMQSAGHRTNILNCTYTQTGIGYYYQANDQANVCISGSCTNGPYYHYWTQDFARP